MVDSRHWTRDEAEQQLARRLLIGFDGSWWDQPTWLYKLVEQGLAGLIFFRQNFRDFEQPEALKLDLQRIQAQFREAGILNPLFGIDQEGGAVVRLPDPLFPSLLSPRAASRLTDEDLQAHYDALAQGLAWYGFNLNFAPTLDVLLNRANRVIGVRSFGESASAVWRGAKAVLSAHRQAGVLAVGKHFPGHGHGIIDSHESLPELTYSPQEIEAFQQAIVAGMDAIPALLIAHGVYPNTWPWNEALFAKEAKLPASLNRIFLEHILRRQLNFEGLTFSDDMVMGAMAETGLSPAECAMEALNAGCDVVVYRSANDEFKALWDELIEMTLNGKLDTVYHGQAVKRVNYWVNTLQKPLEFSSAITEDALSGWKALQTSMSRWQQQSLGKQVQQAQQGLKLAIEQNKPLYVLEPDREFMGNYALDKAARYPSLAVQLEAKALELTHLPYTPETQLDGWLNTQQPEQGCLVLVTWLPRLGYSALEQMRHWQAENRNLQVIHIAAGLEAETLPDSWLELPLHSYRADAQALLIESLFSRRLGKLVGNSSLSVSL